MAEPVRRLGDGMAGRVLPLHDSLGKSSEPAILYFGIIDFLQVRPCLLVGACVTFPRSSETPLLQSSPPALDVR